MLASTDGNHVTTTDIISSRSECAPQCRISKDDSTYGKFRNLMTLSSAMHTRVPQNTSLIRNLCVQLQSRWHAAYNKIPQPEQHKVLVRGKYVSAMKSEDALAFVRSKLPWALSKLRADVHALVEEFAAEMTDENIFEGANSEELEHFLPDE